MQSGRCSREEQKEIFMTIEDKNYHIFQHILSFVEPRKYFVDLLSEKLSASDESLSQEEYKNLLKNAGLESVFSKIRVSVGLRDWLRKISNVVNNEGEICIEKDESKLLASCKHYPAWSKKLQSLFLDVQRYKNQFAQRNMGLVHLVAIKNKRRSDLTKEDLVQEAYFGLVEAIDKFDYRKECLFSTYATWWLRHAMNRAIDKEGGLIRIPSHLNDYMIKLSNFKKEHFETHGRAPTQKEIKEKFNKRVEKQSFEFIRMNSTKRFAHQGQNEQDGNTWDQFLEDEKCLKEFSKIDNMKIRAIIFKSMESLNKKEKTIITRRFNLEGKEDNFCTLANIGEEFGFSRERIRQLEGKALGKIRSNLNKEDFF